MGSRRYRITVKGPGGHSYLNFGRVNPIHALGRIIAKFSTIEVPADPKTTYNVGMIGGGTSVNSIPFEAWAEVDMRSSDEHEIDKMEQKLLQFAREGVAEENRLRASSATELTLEPKVLAVRKAVHTDPACPLVRAAEWAAREMGLKPQLAVGSTDSNAPESMGIPAVTLTAGGKGGNFHSLEEWFDSTDAWKGVQQVFLTTVAFDTL
jgi:acetylornithine deacetylase/succinyl-diaminopimelate desuccinylase-like protein